jgi:hypothetical protein
MRLDLDLGTAVLSFTGPRSDGPYPLLERVGALRMAARAGTPSGITSGEAPSIEVSLDNAGKRAAAIVDYPLRRRATIYDDAGAVYFEGTVAAMTVGRSLVLTVEA